MIIHGYVIFFTYYIGKIVQNITLSEPLLPNERNYLDKDEFEALKREFKESISVVYGHPKDLVEVEFEERRPKVAILTFNIKRNSQKDSLLAVMKDNSSLIARLDEQFKNVEKLSTLSAIKLSEPMYTENSGKIFMHW